MTPLNDTALTVADRPPSEVTPRFLADLDHGNVGPIIDALTDAGWTAWPDFQANVPVFDPSGRLAVEFLPEVGAPPWTEDQYGVFEVNGGAAVTT